MISASDVKMSENVQRKQPRSYTKNNEIVFRLDRL